jgi:hypothetical protein
MSFLSNLTTFGVPTSRTKAMRFVDPLQRMKEKFIARVREQIDFVQAGDFSDARSWVKRVKRTLDGVTSFIVSLRNGTKTLPLNDSAKHLEVKSEELLLKFFEEAIAACERGELDQLLIQTMQKQKGGV